METHTRIRYAKNEQTNVLTSEQLFTLGDKKLRVTIVEGPKKVSTHTFQITDSLTGEVVSQGDAKLMAYAKKAAKSAMANLGIQFTNEKRERAPKVELLDSEVSTIEQANLPENKAANA